MFRRVQKHYNSVFKTMQLQRLNTGLRFYRELSTTNKDIKDQILRRIQLFEKYYKEQAKELEEKATHGKDIIVKVGDREFRTKSYASTPMDIAKSSMNKKEYNKIMGARVTDPKSGKTSIVDMTRPITDSVNVEFIFADERDGLEIFWHSSAHILGHSLEQLYSCLLCTGPVKEHEGFYYDANFPEESKTLSSENLTEIQESVNKLISQKNEFQRIDITYDKAVELFKENKFKLELIDKHIKDNTHVSVYRVGELVDFCEGPHLPHSGYIGEIVIQKQSGSYWQGNVNNPKTQRIHGISFRTKENYKQWKTIQEEIAKRDHRVIGKQQRLFSFEAESPGMASFLPNGAFIYNKLIEFLRREYLVRGYKEVITPNVFSVDLWMTSGHYDNYKDDMFLFKSDNKVFGMKPMNCPAH